MTFLPPFSDDFIIFVSVIGACLFLYAGMHYFIFIFSRLFAITTYIANYIRGANPEITAVPAGEIAAKLSMFETALKDARNFESALRATCVQEKARADREKMRANMASAKFLKIQQAFDEANRLKLVLQEALDREKSFARIEMTNIRIKLENAIREEKRAEDKITRAEKLEAEVKELNSLLETTHQNMIELGSVCEKQKTHINRLGEEVRGLSKDLKLARENAQVHLGANAPATNSAAELIKPRINKEKSAQPNMVAENSEASPSPWPPTETSATDERALKTGMDFPAIKSVVKPIKSRGGKRKCAELSMENHSSKTSPSSKSSFDTNRIVVDVPPGMRTTRPSRFLRNKGKSPKFSISSLGNKAVSSPGFSFQATFDNDGTTLDVEMRGRLGEAHMLFDKFPNTPYRNGMALQYNINDSTNVNFRGDKSVNQASLGSHGSETAPNSGTFIQTSFGTGRTKDVEMDDCSGKAPKSHNMLARAPYSNSIKLQSSMGGFASDTAMDVEPAHKASFGNGVAPFFGISPHANRTNGNDVEFTLCTDTSNSRQFLHSNMDFDNIYAIKKFRYA